MKLVKIGATWCGGCKVLDAQLKQIKQVEVISLDVEQDFEKVEKLPKVKNLPTLFVMSDNEEVLHTWVGVVKARDITQKLEELSS